MKTGAMILLNIILLGAFGYWLWREFRRASPGVRRWLLPALAWRLVLTTLSNLHPSPDMVGPEKWGRLLSPYLWARPSQVLLVLQDVGFYIGDEAVTFYKWSNTLFYHKVFILLSLASGGLLWLNGLYLSLLCFVACWMLVRAMSQTFPLAPAAAAGLAFLAWPTVVWWTAGLTKETLLLGAGAGLVAAVLPAIYGGWPAGFWASLGRAVLALVLAWLMVRIRYFFALPLLSGLLVLGAIRVAARRGWLRRRRLAQACGLGLILGLAGGTMVLLHQHPYVLRYFCREINANYLHGLQSSVGRPHIAFADWQPTPLGLLQHAPWAAVQVLVRPWLGEAKQAFYLAAALENLLLMSLSALALLAAWRGRAGRLPIGFVAVLAVHCLLLAAFIGLTTPNLGTLSRYRTAMLPWLLLLLLQNDYARGLLRKLGQWTGGR